MDYLAGIDLGSTSLKCVIYDLAGNVVASGAHPTECYNPYPDHPEWTVWQPEQIWGGTAEAMKEAIAQLDDPCHIKAVAVTGMGMDGVPVDEQGDWLYPFISWHDPRTEAQLRWWESQIGAEWNFRVGGNTLWRFNTALRLLWMAEHEPGILARTDKWLLIEDFLNFMLCGKRATDYTMASCTLLFDQRKRDWSQEILTQAGIDRRLLCDAYPSGTLLGEVTSTAAEATGLPAGTPVVLGGHDYLCGALPVGAFRPGVVLDVTGTWEIVLAAIPAPVLTPDVQKLGVTVETHVARDTYAVWGGAVASDMLEWYRREYGFEAQQMAEKEGGVDWDYLMTQACASPAGARGVMFLPHMSAAGCPVVDDRSLGAFVGLSNFVQRGDMLRAIVEGLDYQVLDIVTALKSGLGICPDRLVVVGGATRNPFWMQNKADITGMPIDVPDVEESTSLGAAILAGIGVGIYRDEQDAFERVYRPGKTYRPDPQLASRYAEWYQIYKQLYPVLKPVNHQLYDQFPSLIKGVHSMNELEHVVAAQNKLGETPIWSPEENALYWVDWGGGPSSRFEPGTGKFVTFPVDMPVTALARRASGGLIAVAFQGIYGWEPKTNEYKQIFGPAEPGRPEICYNDATVDRQGRLLVGTVNMHDPFTPDGSLFRLDPDGSFHKLDTGYATANGIGVSPDGRTIYVTDQRHRQIIVLDYDTVDGTAGNRRLFACLPEGEGMPDGLIVDAEGFVWSGHWDGWRLTRYDPDGKVERQVRFPVQHVISFAFGGPELDELFITTSTWDFSGEQRKQQPWAGGLLRLCPGVRGLVEPAFAG